MTRHFTSRALAAIGLACAALGAHAANVSLSGSLYNNTDVAQVTFRLDAVTADVNVFTTSWLAGLNFDPTAAVWFKTGGVYTLVAEVDDNDTIGAGQGAFDAGLHFDSLVAGDYLVTIAASPNYATGPLLQNGFAFDGTTPIALADWVQPGSNPDFPDQKGGVWSVNLTNVGSVAVIPEPSTWALMGAGLLVSGLVAHRRRPSAGSVIAA